MCSRVRVRVIQMKGNVFGVITCNDELVGMGVVHDLAELAIQCHGLQQLWQRNRAQTQSFGQLSVHKALIYPGIHQDGMLEPLSRGNQQGLSIRMREIFGGGG